MVRTSWSGLVVLAIALGCAVGEARPEGPEPAPADPTPGRAAPDRPGVPGPEAEARASALLDEARVAYEEPELMEALDLARRVLTEFRGTEAASSARWVAARSAFGLGRYEEARELAETYRRDQPAGTTAEEEATALVELAADALDRPGAAMIGAILPRSGSQVLVQYGDWVLEGIELAIGEAERRLGRSIELEVADDGGGPYTAEAIAQLEQRGVVAIIGPLLPHQLPDAVAARVNPRLLLVSPTVSESPSHWSSFYSLASGDTRGAQELGRYAAQIGLGTATVLHARGSDYASRARAFAAEYEARGGRVRATVSYESGTTTFASHMGQILAAGGGDGEGGTTGRSPFALYVVAPERDVPQIAPQISYYGVDAAGAQVLGDDSWASSPVRRVVPSRDLEGVVATSPLPPGRDGGLADPDFVAAFEQTYRRSLTNQMPALGYDAARVVIESLPNRLLTPAATARRFELLTGMRGATGTLSVRGARLIRIPHLVIIRNGELEPAPLPWEHRTPAPADHRDPR